MAEDFDNGEVTCGVSALGGPAMAVHDLIRSFAEDEAVPEDVAAAKVIAAASDADRESMATYWVAHEIRWRRAANNRAKERKAEAAHRKAEAESAGFPTVKAYQAWLKAERDRKAAEGLIRGQEAAAFIEGAVRFTTDFLNAPFLVSDDRHVSWGEATAEEHKQGVAFMLRAANGIRREVELHNEVIDLLARTRVVCLNALGTRPESVMSDA